MISSLFDTPAKISASYRSASRTGQLPLWLISAIALYMPLEDFIVAWLPVPAAVRTGIRFIPEIILYAILARTLFHRIATGQPIRKTPIDILILVFFLTSIVSIVLNQASLFGSITELRFNWRYLSIYYTLANIDIQPAQLSILLRNLKIIGLFQAGLAAVQIFIPAQVKIAIAAGNCDKAITKGANCGTFLDSALLSGFLLLILSVTCAEIWTAAPTLIPTLKDTANLLVLYAGLFASKKRIALFVGAMIPIIVLYLLGKRREVSRLVWFTLAIAIAFWLVLPSLHFGNVSQAEEGNTRQGLTTYFAAVFSAEYWEHNLEASRGWFMVNVSKSIALTGSWFGFGPEPESLIRGMKTVLANSTDVAKLERDADAFEDAYWFVVMGYFGIVGLFLYWVILWKLYQASRWLMRAATTPSERSLGVMFCTITALGFFYSFSERLFKLRPFSFYFWLLAGLVISMCYRQSRLIKENRTQG